MQKNVRHCTQSVLLWIQDKHIFNISLLLFLKPITDMFYQFRFLDALLLAYAAGVLVFSAGKIARQKIDLIALLIILMFTQSFLKNVSFGSLLIYIKIISQYLLFFIARKSYEDTERYVSVLQKSYLIVLITNLLAIGLGYGTVLWGEAHTLRGMYYYKTDLSIAMLQLIILFIMKSRWSWYDFLVMLAGFSMIVLSNSRLFFILSVEILFAAFLYRYESRMKLPLRIGFKLFIGFALVGVLAIFLQKQLNSITYFQDANFITFDFTDAAYNTQGRATIWKVTFARYMQAGPLDRIFGIDLTSDMLYNGFFSANAHNMYLKNLFCIGLAGLIVSLIFYLLTIPCFNRLKDRNLF